MVLYFRFFGSIKCRAMIQNLTPKTALLREYFTCAVSGRAVSEDAHCNGKIKEHRKKEGRVIVAF